MYIVTKVSSEEQLPSLVSNLFFIEPSNRLCKCNKNEANFAESADKHM